MKDPKLFSTNRAFSVPSAFHEVLGERQTPGALLAIALAVVVFALVWGERFVADFGWRQALAALLAIDIVAGAAANFTRGTNDFYAQRPIHRWVFIAIHLHLLGLGWLLGWDMLPLFAVWVGTIVCAGLVNLTGNRPAVGGFCLVLGLILLPTLALDHFQLCLSMLFFFKVSYSFAVDHYGK